MHLDFMRLGCSNSKSFVIFVGIFKNSNPFRFHYIRLGCLFSIYFQFNRIIVARVQNIFWFILIWLGCSSLQILFFGIIQTIFEFYFIKLGCSNSKSFVIFRRVLILSFQTRLLEFSNFIFLISEDLTVQMQNIFRISFYHTWMLWLLCLNIVWSNLNNLFFIY